MSILNKIKQTIKSFMAPNDWMSEEEIIAAEFKEWNKLKDELILFAGDSGDGVCREALIECVRCITEYKYTGSIINIAINELLHEGKLLTDGSQIIDPNTIVNGAKIIRSGRYLLSSPEEIVVPDDSCPKCFNKLDMDGRCVNADFDNWKC